MINKLIVLHIAILISMHFSIANDTINPDKNVKITYIANEGFLIEVDSTSILIDALFGDKQYGFCDIPDSSQIQSMRNAEDIFEDVDLIASTHRHIDHFYAPFVIDHLSNNENGKFISCKQSINAIKEADNYKAEINTQLIEITPDSLSFKDTLINGIEIRVFRLKHGPYYVDDPETGNKINRHQNIQNLGFIFNINGIKIFHCGDSNPYCIEDYKYFRLDKENIDIAFLGRGFMWSADYKGVDIIRDYIKPKHIVLMHIHHDHNNTFIDVAEKLKDEFPSIKVFEKRMETISYMIE